MAFSDFLMGNRLKSEKIATCRITMVRNILNLIPGLLNLWAK